MKPNLVPTSRPGVSRVWEGEVITWSAPVVKLCRQNQRAVCRDKCIIVQSVVNRSHRMMIGVIVSLTKWLQLWDNRRAFPSNCSQKNYDNDTMVIAIPLNPNLLQDCSTWTALNNEAKKTDIMAGKATRGVGSGSYYCSSKNCTFKGLTDFRVLAWIK